MFNFATVLDRAVDRSPDQPVLIYEAEAVTSLELHRRVNELASALRESGVGRGSVVAVLMRNRPEFIECMYAVARLGAILLPLNFRLAPEEWGYILDHSGADVFIAEDDLFGAADSVLPELAKRLTGFVIDGKRPGHVEYERALTEHAGAQVATEELGQEDIQRLMYTSGTTSRPKGVPLSCGNLLWKCVGHLVELGITARDRTLVAGPLYHVGGLDLPGTSVLYAGGSLVILKRFDPLEVLKSIERDGVTNLWLAPAMLNMLLQMDGLDGFDASGVRLIIGGGEKMPDPVMALAMKTFPNAWLADAYGLTETVSGDTFLDPAHADSKRGSVGRPVPHLRIRIVDEDDNTMPPNRLGEILLQGPKVFSGYWKDENATASAIRNGWFHTGDIGRLDEDGFLWIEDRKKDMITSGGENIATPEVERVLYEHPAVLEAAVIGMASDKWGEVPKAFAVLRPGMTASAGELIAHCAGKLARFKVPAEIVFLPELPRTPSGKVLKRNLRDD